MNHPYQLNRSGGWRHISEIPKDETVMIYSVKGIKCRAKVQTGATLNEREFPPRIACWRCEGYGGDIMATTWRYL